MHKEFVKYDQAVALKELGFDIPVNASWIINKMYPQGIIGFGSWQNSNSSDNHLSAPLKQQVFRWFRDKYGIFVSIVPYKYGSLDSFIGWIYIPSNGSTKDIDVGGRKGFKTPEETESVCIDKLIEIVKEE